MNLKPLNNNVIVKALNKEEITKSGIVLPETMSKEKPERGEIIAVSENLKTSVKVGDKIIFKKYSSNEIKIDEETYLVLNEDDILAIIN